MRGAGNALSLKLIEEGLGQAPDIGLAQSAETQLRAATRKLSVVRDTTEPDAIGGGATSGTLAEQR